MAAAAPAANGSSSVLVLDVSGSMGDPAQIPPDFPQAAELKAREDSVGRLVEQAHPGNKVPLSVIAGGLLGLPDLITLQGNLDTYLKQRNIDPQSISKLTALKASAGTVLIDRWDERTIVGARRASPMTWAARTRAAILQRPCALRRLPSVASRPTSGARARTAGWG